MNTTVDSLIEEASRDLLDPLETRREAQILLGHALGVSRAWICAHGDERPEAPAAGVFHDLMRRRRSGAPIAYLVGKREFYGLDFRVTPDVLIPRADTEALVDAALQKLDRDNEHEILDLGTGSGCVAITIAHELPRARVTAVDASPAALGVARDNAAAIGADVEFLHGSWFEPLAAKRFDLIVSNPPYVAAGDPHLLRGDLRFEPATALIAGKDGLTDIRRIVAGAPAHLRPGGWLLFEHGYDQADVCRDLLHDAGFDDVVSLADIAGLARVAGGRLLTPKSTNR